MFTPEFSPEFLKSLKKLSKKDKQLSTEVIKKISQILSNDKITINHYKNLRGPLKEFKRVHIGSHVILFRVKDDTIYVEDFQHHDQAYD
jgi:YafQ family addiction module toxin component